MHKKPQDIEEIDKRIDALKAKTINKDESDNSRFPQVAIAFQSAIEMLSGVLIGIGIGYILDEIFDTKFIFLLIFTIFGCMAGLVNIARYLKKIDEER